MALLAQHGYGKGEKLQQALEAKLLVGAILSPRDEMAAGMPAVVRGIRESQPNALVLFDPQFYASTIDPVEDGKLPQYPYYKSSLTRRNFTSAASIERYVKDVLDYQLALGV